MSDKFGFFDPYFRSNGPFSFFGRDRSLDPTPVPDAAAESPAPDSLLQPIADRRGAPPAGTASQPSDEDVNALARMIFGEATSLYQVPGAMEGIGWVARNRMGAPGFPDTLQGVLTQPDAHGKSQFQTVGNATSPGSPEWRLSADPSQLHGPDVAGFQRAHDVARGILSGEIPDPTGGATFYITSPWAARRPFKKPVIPPGKAATVKPVGNDDQGWVIFYNPAASP